MRTILLVAIAVASACGYVVPARIYASAPPAALPTRLGQIRLCTPMPPADMRVKALKEELDERGVAWRGVAFEKEELVSLLVHARAQPPVADPTTTEPVVANPEPDASDSSTTAAASDDEPSEAYAAAYEAALADAMQKKTKELRTELAARSVGWADLYEKEELAARLAGLVARAALFSRSGALSPGAVGVVDTEECRSELADLRSPLVLDVFATWCGPCRLIAPMLESISQKAGERCRFAKLDSDANPELSTELRVQGLPTLIFVRDGKEVHRLEGVPGNGAALEALVSQHLGVEL